MFIKKNEDKAKSKNNNIIEIKQNVEGDYYTLKIYFSKGKDSIVFKIEPEKIKTYYFYEKFYLLDLKNQRKYALENSIEEIFKNLEYSINEKTTKIEKDLSKMKINVINNNI